MQRGHKISRHQAPEEVTNSAVFEVESRVGAVASSRHIRNDFAAAERLKSRSVPTSDAVPKARGQDRH
jgi:hypothetical protein